MWRLPTRIFFRLSALLLTLLFLSHADARPVSPWTLERIAEKAEVLVVGEVLEVTTVGSIAREETRWKIPLLRKSARVRVLRHFASKSESPAEGEEISLEFQAVDREKGEADFNGLQFPNISTGDVTIFPLRKTPSDSTNEWELIDEEDFALLVPALRETPYGPKPASGLDFLRTELAGVFSRGNYPDIFRAARYVASMGYSKPDPVSALHRLVASRVKEDEERWLKIAVACYCAGGISRPKISELDTAKLTLWRAELLLANTALKHVGDKDLADRFIALSLKNMRLHYWGTAVTIAINGRRNPTAVKLLNQALKDDVPEAIYIAEYIIRDNEHPVLPAALRAARKVLLSDYEWEEYNTFRAACELIRDYGGEDDFQFFLDEIRKAQEADRERYSMLWDACAYVQTKRLIPIIRIVIEDRSPLGKRRFCGSAAFELQRITGENFGLTSDQSAEERDEAIAKARAWLASNAPSIPPVIGSKQGEKRQEPGSDKSSSAAVESRMWPYLLLGVVLLALFLVAIHLFLRRRKGAKARQ